MEIAVQDMPIIRRKKRPPKKKKRPQIAGQFCFKKEKEKKKDKISSPRHAWKRKNNKKGNEQRHK